jgi:predicted metal-dependent peptidase
MKDCSSTIESTQLISASLLRLRMKSPFFGTLAMFVRFIPSANITAAATDGKDVFFNPNFLNSLPSAQQDGLLLHEILHAALLHPLRLRERDPQQWNIAADIVVNGMILRQTGFELPPGGLRDRKLEHLSVEEVYELLPPNAADRFQLNNPDLLTPNVGDLIRSTADESGSAKLQQPERIDRNYVQDLTAHWQQAFQQATAVANSCKPTSDTLGTCREWESVVNPQLDWQSILWQYLAQNPTDFQGFDRRFVGRGLYLEALQGESVRVYIAVDTSGSIKATALGLFLAEVRSILGAYPHLICDLYYVDSDVYGPHALTSYSTLPIPRGGGGSSFAAFFDRVAETCNEQVQPVCIYLTDGYGEFPTTEPSLPTLWVVTPGGLDLALFPFGETVRLLDKG